MLQYQHLYIDAAVDGMCFDISLSHLQIYMEASESVKTLK